jgi:hypothetical protein
MELSLELITLLFLVAAFAGFIDAAAGGGGLITIPTLMLTGMSPAQALGTNKFQACFGSFSASLHFIRQGLVRPGAMIWTIVAVAIAAATGAFLVQQIDPQLLMSFMPIIFISIALYSFFSKSMGKTTTQQKISNKLYATTIAPCIGCYDGFAGPGTGTFFALSHVKLLGMDFIRATAKILNFTSNIFSLLVFAQGGEVIWAAGFCMAAGQLIGARMGAKTAIEKGAGYIRLITVIVSIAISVGLLLRY